MRQHEIPAGRTSQD